MEKKFIESYAVSDYEIWTDTGWEDIVGTNKTVEYDVWDLKTETHELSCADTHIVFNNEFNETFISELSCGSKIYTDKGIERVMSLKNTGAKAHMYDLQLPFNSNKRYYTNGVLSHNTTIMTIYALWLTCFQSDKTVLIVANKEDTAIKILRRIRMAYEHLPNWIKPGVKQWGKTEVVFANDSRISISSTSSSSSRGESANCVGGDSVLELRWKKTKETFKITIKELADILKGNGKLKNITIIED